MASPPTLKNALSLDTSYDNDNSGMTDSPATSSATLRYGTSPTATTTGGFPSKARSGSTSSASGGGASKVRGLAAKWETKPSTVSPGSSPPKTLATAGRARAASSARIERIGTGNSAFPSTRKGSTASSSASARPGSPPLRSGSPRGPLAPKLSTSPKTPVTPPSAFKSINPRTGVTLGSSGAKVPKLSGADPAASPPPLPATAKVPTREEDDLVVEDLESDKDGLPDALTEEPLTEESLSSPLKTHSLLAPALDREPESDAVEATRGDAEPTFDFSSRLSPTLDSRTEFGKAGSPMHEPVMPEVTLSHADDVADESGFSSISGYSASPAVTANESLPSPAHPDSDLPSLKVEDERTLGHNNSQDEPVTPPRSPGLSPGRFDNVPLSVEATPTAPTPVSRPVMSSFLERVGTAYASATTATSKEVDLSEDDTKDPSTPTATLFSRSGMDPSSKTLEKQEVSTPQQSLFSRASNAITDFTSPRDSSASPVTRESTPPSQSSSIFSRVGAALPDLSAPPNGGAKEKELPKEPAGTAAPAAGKSFFTSATSALNSFSLPTVNLSRTSASEAPATPEQRALPAPTPSAAHLGPTSPQPGSATNWRATMTSFLSSRTSPSPQTPPMPTTPSRNGSSSTAFILNRMDSVAASRDRRVSREGGGGAALRQGFERVRNEMEGAARDIRRERAAAEAEASESSDAESSTHHHAPEDGVVDWTFWGAVVQDYEEVARTRPKDLSRAIQQGIPPVIRGPIWQLMSSSKSTDLEETYKALLKLTSPHEKAIHKDISRTFPNHKFFQGTGAGQEGLFMVCKAYSLYDREVGYTQGLAFIIAALLLNMPDEEAFCVLVRLMDSYNLRSHYLADMPGLQLRLYQFDRLLEDILPLLHNHLLRKGVKSSMFASQWFMTLFSYRFPLSLVYRVLDIVLAEGIEAMFRFSIALLRKSEDEIVQLEFEDILAYLQGDLFEIYRVSPPGTPIEEGMPDIEENWRTNDFVRDAYDIRITPLMLDQYESEWNEKCRAQDAHMRELDQLRSANRHLSTQVKTLEGSLATMNTEHVELVRQLVLAKIAKEDMENELVKYKSMCAQLAQARPEDVALPRANSNVSLLSGKALPSRGASHTTRTPSPSAAAPFFGRRSSNNSTKSSPPKTSSGGITSWLSGTGGSTAAVPPRATSPAPSSGAAPVAAAGSGAPLGRSVSGASVGSVGAEGHETGLGPNDAHPNA